MSTFLTFRSLIVGVLSAFFLALTAAGADAQVVADQGKINPSKVTVIVPGLTGSELVNSKTGEVVWFKAPRSKDDDLRLPISANIARNRDSLKPGDILRSVKVGIFPRIDVYGGLVDSLVKNGGYYEDAWLNPATDVKGRRVFVFAYDWRLDNVENARQLIRSIIELRKKLNQPDLKVDLIAHSMGGIISRYAAMYGDADLPVGRRKPVPTWAGAKYIDRIVLMGVPNEGSPLALRALVEGFAIGGININLPFVQNLTKFDNFTIPSAFQLLPAPGTLKALDGDLKPIDIDLYDTRTWTRYGWNPIRDRKFQKEFTPAEFRAAPAYFRAVLDRAKRLHEALAAPTSSNGGVRFEIVGADCNPTLDAIMILPQNKGVGFKTLFRPATVEIDGEKFKTSDTKAIMLAPGDGVVTKRSLLAETESRAANVESILRPSSVKFICAEHNQLGANPDVEGYLIELFGIKP